MKYLAAILVLVLALTNASKYLQPEHQRGSSVWADNYRDMLASAIEDDNFSDFSPSITDSNRWDSLANQKILFSPESADSWDYFLKDKPKDLRIKRLKTSLSIDNPLDVLRQQYYRALARRMKVKSIEKNREHLLKTGKRSPKEYTYPLILSKSSENPLKNLQNNFVEKGFADNEKNFIVNNDHSLTTRRLLNFVDDMLYEI